MAEFKLGRIKFVWKDNWVTGTTYYKDDIVAYGGKTYVCVIGHTADADFYTDLENVPARWNQFSDGQAWKGDWADATLYKENDIVKYGGYVYICNNGHTSSTTLELNQSDWDLFAEGFNWTGTWTTSTTYKVNDLVKYGGYVYICNTAHDSAALAADGLEDNSSDWDIFSKGVDWKGEWATSTRYKVGDLVKYDGTTYICNTGHTSDSTEADGLEADQSKWDYFNQGVEYKGAWTTATRYKINDLVKSGGSIWICTTYHTSSNFVTDNANWNQFVQGVQFESDWVISTEYQPGDIVRYGGNTYLVKVALDASTVPPSDTDSYDLFTTGFRLQGDWNAVTTYKVGEVVRLGGFTYVAIADTLNNVPPNLTYWEKLNEGIQWHGDWASAQTYVLGDSVKYGPNSYICILGHSSTTGSDRPDNDITGTYWNLLTAGNEESVLTTIGDLAYYSGAGPTRLPIGDEGQVLTVDAGMPTWKYFGKVSNVFYVGPAGTNTPAPTYGVTLDKPWASLRYALEQIENGTEYPQAGQLLKLNRTFIQREIYEWVTYQIANPTGIWVGFVDTNPAFCQRDMGLIVDAIIYDLTHTGNVKTTDTTLVYFNAAGTALQSFVDFEAEQTVAAINYGVELIQAVLANTAPVANYQTLNSVGSPTLQIIDTNYTAETGAADICVGLAAIVTDAITAGNTSGMPLVDTPNYTINLKTGEYFEVLPMHVPANVAIVGDELRSSRVSPQGKVIATTDKIKSVETLQHIQGLLGDIITNTSVTPTSGNTETQDTSSQRAGSGSDTGVILSNNTTVEMKNILENGISAAREFVYPDPTDYNTSYLIGYGDARAQLLANKAFIVDEITEWIAAQVAGPTAPFAGDFTYDSVACERDVGYIIDALVYDLTYGGNLQTVVAARSYFSGGSAVYGAGEKEEVLAAYAHLKDVVGYVINENTGWLKSTGLTQDTSGTAGSAGSITFAQDRIQEIYDSIDTEIVVGSKQATVAALQTAKDGIAAATTRFINTTYPTLEYTPATCARDIGLIIDAVCYDLITGSNVATSVAGIAYYRVQSAVVTGSQLTETLAAINYAKSLALGYVDNCLQTAAAAAFTNVYNILDGGLGAVPTYTWPANGSTTATTIADAAALQSNRSSYQTDVANYLSANYPELWASLGGAGQAACSRDVGYIVDAIAYDIQYGGNYQSVIAGNAYFSFGTMEIAPGEVTATLAAYTQLATLMKVDTSAGGDTRVDELIADIIAIISSGAAPTVEYPAIGSEADVIAPSTAWVDTDLATAGANLLAASNYIRAEAIEFVNTKFPTLTYNEALCSRDVGYIIEALAYDAMFGSNYMSIKAAMSYHRALTSTGVVTGAQLQPTLGLVDFVFGKAQSEFRLSPVASAIISRTREIAEILQNGASYSNTVSYADPTNYNTSYLIGYGDARALLLANKDFLKAEALAYVNYNFVNYDSHYTAATCARDVGLIIDAVVYDLVTGSNFASSVAGLAYYRVQSAAVLGSQLIQTTKAIEFAKTNAYNYVDATLRTESDAAFDNILAILAGSPVPTYTWPDNGTSTSTTVADAALIQTNRATLIAGVQSYLQGLGGTYSTLSPGDKATCARDIGYVIDAITYDVQYGGNYQTVIAGLAYYSGAVLQIPGGEKAETLLAYSELESEINALGGFVSTATVTSLVSDLNGIIDTGTSPTVTAPSASGESSAVQSTVANIIGSETAFAAEVTQYITDTFSSMVYDKAACQRDVGYIVDALAFDLTYGGNLATVIAARSYYSFGTFVEPTDEALAAASTQARIKAIIGDILTGVAITKTSGNTLTQVTSGTAGSAGAVTFAEDRIQEIYDMLVTGTVPTTIPPSTSWVDSGLIAAKATIDSFIDTIKADAVQYVKREYAEIDFDNDVCSRDIVYITDAIGYDMMFGSNFLTVWNGMAYRRGITSTALVVAEQSGATAAIVNYIGAQASKLAAEGNVELANLLMSDIIAYVNSGFAPIVTGTNRPTEDLTMIDAGQVLMLNKEFLAAEAAAYIANTFTASVTASSTTTFTADTTLWMVVGDKVQFSGTTFGGVSTATDYYISAIVSSTEFKVSNTLGGTSIDLTTATGTMSVSYTYDVAACKGDIRHYVDAIAADMMYTGNYNSVRAARYYRSALTGSKLEDMFYVRNGCGIRNMTLFGLDGTSDGNTAGAGDADGLTVANEFGTQRPLAGAYVSLDPGWGPNDNRVWVTTRSTYVQNVTTFGTAATGQKIDGSLHNGGVDSIVSNDFTQVISNGIGAWVTNLGRAELVSVFTYYSHIGYLAENGGKIRATNGNNSYGDFGSVSEGVDVTETPVIGEINNRASEASVRSVITDGNNILAYEFGNAGSEYHEATFVTSGSGFGVSTLAEEFRDGAVFNVRLTDPGDSSGTGGVGYITAANQAQAGNTTQITIAAADTASSSAYVGMSLYLTSGTGAGQYGYIQSYNAGSKIATIYKESTGTAGWDHVVPGTPIESALDVTTAYSITPRLSFSAPAFTTSAGNDLPLDASWTDVVYGDAYGSYTNLSATGGSGSLASFNVVRRSGQYTVELNIPGALYAVGDELTISGALLGGASPLNDLTITVNTVNSPSGSISSVTASGTAISGKYVAIASGTNQGAYSVDGLTWTAMTMPATVGAESNMWSAIAYGVVNNIGYYVAVARASSTAAYSKDGVNWTASTLTEVVDWCDIAYGNGSFVAISESDSSVAYRAVSTNAGASWNINTLASGAKAIAFGGTRFVLVEGNFSNSVAYSTGGSAWTVTTLPANDDSSESDWTDIAYGNGRFVAVAASSAMAAYSFNGSTWYASTLPALYNWNKVTYGQGVFYATSTNGYAATSNDGVVWTLRDIKTGSFNVTAAAKDNISAGYTETSSNLVNGTWSDMIYADGKFIAVGWKTTTGKVSTSIDGITWTDGDLPTVSTTYEYTSVAYNGTDQYVAIIGGNGGTRNIAYSSNLTLWTGQVTALTSNSYWKKLIWAGDRYIAMRGDGAAINYSTNGTSWTNVAVSGGSSEMSSVAYGNIGGTDYIVTVAGYLGGSQISSYSTNGGTSWTSASSMPSSDYWADIAFNNGKFVAIAGGTSTTTTKAAYSTDGSTWTAATMPGASASWNKVVASSTGFIAYAYNSDRTAYSEDGITWVEGPAQENTRNWAAAAYGSTTAVSIATGAAIASYATFVLNTNYLTASDTSELRAGDKVMLTGATFGGLTSGVYYYVKSVASATQFTVAATPGGSTIVLSTGSGTAPVTATRDFTAAALGNYQGTPRWVVVANGTVGVQNIRQGATTRARAYVLDDKIAEIWIHEPGSGYTTAPTLTITDPNNVGADATADVRVGNGAIAQPTFISRGTNYTAAAAEISGDGYADNYQVTAYVAFKNLTGVPKAGANVQIAGINDVWYRLVNVTALLTNDDGTYNATLQLSPALGAAEAPEHGTVTTIRRRYSQVRLTGHDLLDIGTGDFINSNYPGLPLNDPIPANEYRLSNGGRVFYTSTDQDGNFRVGGLFNVEQATGVATLNADAFNIAGLNELSLGSVALGGSGATITEFSTDPFFTSDSDTVVPTQRAIKAYITSQIGGGGSSLNVNTLTAGVVYIAGQTIATTTNVAININTKVNFTGGVVGDALVMNYFLLKN